MFRAKKDKSFLVFILIFVLITASVFLWPLYFDKNRTTLDIIIVTGLVIFSTGVLMWCALDIKYVFYEEFLFVKGGLFRSKIAYRDVTKVVPANDVLTGYRILSSKDALEVFYKTAILGSVKISPQDQDRFIEELRKRCPHLPIQRSIQK